MSNVAGEKGTEANARCRPEWDRMDKQIFGPGQTYSWESSWTFGVL